MIQVSDILDLSNSNALKLLAVESARETAVMHQLTQKATHDAAAVKVLTILTLIYLPATVISVRLNSHTVLILSDSIARTSFRPLLSTTIQVRMAVFSWLLRAIGGSSLLAHFHSRGSRFTFGGSMSTKRYMVNTLL